MTYKYDVQWKQIAGPKVKISKDGTFRAPKVKKTTVLVFTLTNKKNKKDKGEIVIIKVRP